MAAKKAAKTTGEEKGPPKTEKINVWLEPDQVAWLKSKKNVSESLRALVTEAMSLENLAKSVKAGASRKKKAK